MEVRVPDIGDFSDVPVIEIHVSAGDTVAAEDPLVTLESDKATMDVPSPAAGTVSDVLVSIDDRVSEGSPLLVLETEAASGEPGTEQGSTGDREEGPAGEQERARPAREEATAHGAAENGTGFVSGGGERGIDLLVVGGGIGGYSAAFRAADLGLDVTLVERYERLGGVCLNVGCIPSKALLHGARVVAEVEEARDFGISFGEPEVDLGALRGWKDDVVSKLTGGLDGLAKQRGVRVVTATAKFADEHAVEAGGERIAFGHCIVASGSRPATLPNLPGDPRIVDSTGALQLAEIPARLLVIGGGIIGLELATVYEALGSRVTVVELTDGLIPGCDRDLVKPLEQRIEGRYDSVLLSTAVREVKAGEAGLEVIFEGQGAPESSTFDAILVAVGRRANGDELGLEASGVKVGERGVIAVDEERRTNVRHIFAIGDVTGEPMLAHKAGHEGRVAAEVIAGRNVTYDPRSIPSVAYTDPEIAWTGLTETEAVAGGVAYEKSVFPWRASGRALATARSEGLTKLLVEPKTRRILGAGVVGPNAGELIAEAVLAIELGADAEDLALTIHPHPTLSETLGFVSEMAEGTITDLMPRKRR